MNPEEVEGLYTFLSVLGLFLSLFIIGVGVENWLNKGQPERHRPGRKDTLFDDERDEQ